MTSVLLAVATVRLRTVHRVALAASGLDVHAVERPDEIANRLTRSGTDLMVIDVTSSFGGSALLQQLSRDADLPAGVLALTPVNDPAVVLASLDAGAADYLPITASSERVLAAVRRIVGADGSAPGPTPVTIGGTNDER